ncbi:MAG: Rne/Rng family ribonuclease [Synergistaceae bacterium]|nr:Rne/Rng family ribonuclease [Synergistaceae bacterium]
MRVAILEDGRLAEVFIERLWENQKAGEIYKARVESVLQGIGAAFVNLGDGRNAFLYLNDAKGLDIKQNQELTVQVTKAARKNKGARVTTRVSLAGRYLVLVPHGNEGGVSRRISGEEERKRLRSLAKKLKGDDYGVIIRTAAENVNEEALAQDVKTLCSVWREIEYDSKKQPSPCLLYRDPGLLGRVLREELSGNVSQIVVDNKEEEENVRGYLSILYGDNLPEVSLYDGIAPIFEFYNIEQDIEAALSRKVWLKSGAWLMIEHSEALTVIDVNTGKYIGKTDLRHTILDTNIEAASEIARQLRLRAIGGIVVIDFIDMEYEEDRHLLIEKLESVFQGDRNKARVFSVTRLGLVELTRKRSRADLRSLLMRSCPCCGETGYVLNEDTIALSIKRFLRKIGHANHTKAALIETHPDVAEYIAENYLPHWEEELERKIFIAAAPSFPWNKYRLDIQGTVERVMQKVSQLEKKGIWIKKSG